ncbi:MAG: transposase [Labilithrix sp.]|nr:transposase [Labilithrix sp.]
MPTDPFRSLRVLWEDCFRRGLTRPGFRNVVVILTGWVLTQGPRAVTEALVVTDVAARRHWEAFHRFFSRGAWSPDVLGQNVFERLRRWFSDETVRVVLDDTIAPKKGPHVFGIGSHLDPVRSTKFCRIFTFGHCWVVLAVVVRLPFSTRSWALPVLFRLYRNLKECEKRRAPYKKKTELAREMVDVLVGWVGERRIELSADSAYCNDTVTRGLPDHVVLFGSMRPDAVLTEAPPPPSKSSQGGRPRKRGRLLQKPERLAADSRTPWQTTTATLYGRVTAVRYKMLVGQWYRATGTRLLRIVIVECTTGRIGCRVFFSTDPSLDVTTVLETYAGRWGIEVFFRDAKQLLGFADSQARKQAAVLRVAPLVGLLYSTLVLWFAEGAVRTPVATLPIRPWYAHKRGFSFADILRTARRTLAGADVLVPFNSFENLHQPERPSPDRVRLARKQAA